MPYQAHHDTTVPVPGGYAHIANGAVKLTPREPDGFVFLGRYDVAELLRRVADNDPHVLELLASVMTCGHRFTGEIGADGTEDAF
jgi:hypothetical protein